MTRAITRSARHRERLRHGVGALFVVAGATVFACSAPASTADTSRDASTAKEGDDAGEATPDADDADDAGSRSTTPCAERVCGSTDGGVECGTCTPGSFCSSAGQCIEGKFEWAGLSWLVSNGNYMPGPNHWDSRNVSIDAAGNLHLTIVQRDGVWTTAGVSATTSLSFGRYQWFVEGPIDRFDPNIVLGLFTFPTAAEGTNGTNEIDVEVSRWGVPSNPNLNYTVWPATMGNARGASSYPMSLSGTYTTHRFDWSASGIAFASFNGFQEADLYPIASWTFSPADVTDLVPHIAVPPHLNLWLVNGQAPTDGASVEVIIHSFSHP